MTAQQIVVQMAVVSAVPDEIARTIESFSRAAAGLALEGLTVQVTATTVPDDEERA